MPFIVLEGLDGAGKSTQIAQLQNYLVECGYEYEYLHFPRFDAPFYGDLIARFLRGELGGVEQVDPYVVAMLYAGDRANAAPKIREWLAAGICVIVDRYVYSNIGYQCAKLEGVEREKLCRWILDFEFNYNALPRPDISIFLNVPFEFTQQKLTKIREGDDRDYLQGSTDIHEASLDLQRRVREVFLDMASLDPHFSVVDCSDGAGAMDLPENVFGRILMQIKHLF